MFYTFSFTVDQSQPDVMQGRFISAGGGCVWKYKRGPISEEMAVEKGTTVAARLVTRCGSDILGQRGRGDDHGGPEGVYSTGIFS